MIQLIYASVATVPFPTPDLRALLAKARERNTPLDVTGFLLHQQGAFLQVLEGEAAVVDKVFDRVSADRRHRRVLMLLKREVEARNFGDWSMGFVDAAAAGSPLPGFRATYALADLTGDSAATKDIVTGFRDGRWRQLLT